MTAKLTLSIDDSVILVAKKYAKMNGKSLSHLIENYLIALSSTELSSENIDPNISKLMGVIELPEDFDYKKSLTNQLLGKYKV
jgi:hypothetical protein